MDMGIAGRTGLVSGASSGIGKAIAVALGREGARLALTARRERQLRDVAGQIEDAGGPAPVVIVQDFLAADAAERIASAALAALGRVDILVNNAGGSRSFGWRADEQAWDEALTLNFTRHRQLTARLLEKMIANGWGRVINITGKSEPDGVNGAFCAKAALHSWAKGLSREVGPDGITVNCVPPGRIMSEQIERNYTPEYREWQSANEIPVGEYGDPNDLAELVCFLASPRARYITGTVIPVDGGLRRYQF
jgi:3-oxoacyl-[acyl-carrier protein] reductase